MNENPPSFQPINALEDALIEAQAGRLDAQGFLDTLMRAQVFVLIDKDPGAEDWDNTATPLVLPNGSGLQVMAVFTAAERSEMWPARIPQFTHGLPTDFRTLVRGIAKEVGIVINPGHAAGLELSADRVAALALGAVLQ